MREERENGEGYIWEKNCGISKLGVLNNNFMVIIISLINFMMC